NAPNTSCVMRSLSTTTPSQSKITRSKRTSVVYGPAALLQPAVPCLAVEALRARGACRLGGLARLARGERAQHEIAKPLERGLLVLLLTPILLRLDHHYSVVGDAVIAQRK